MQVFKLISTLCESYYSIKALMCDDDSHQVLYVLPCWDLRLDMVQRLKKKKEKEGLLLLLTHHFVLFFGGGNAFSGEFEKK